MTKNQFNRLSRRNQRVSIAKDVLLQLKANKFIPAQGVYLQLPDEVENDLVPEDSAQKILKSVPECEVCAKGAMVCSYILNYNSATMADTKNIEDYPEMIEIFGDAMWNILEALFEGWAFDKDGETYQFHHRGIGKFNTSKREYSLESLMKNIVRNGGQFKYKGVLFGS